MIATETIRGKIWEDAGATLMARIVGQDGSNITQASLTAITCKVFDLNSATPDTAVSTPSITIADVVFDTLQTDSRWSFDTTGYNFRHSPSSANFSAGDHRYRIEYKFDPVSGDDFFVVFEVMAHPVRTS